MMTPSQLATLKAGILADPTTAGYIGAGTPGYCVAYLNGDSTFVVWQARTSVEKIMDAIVWANLTPSDAPDGTALWTNRNLQCQSKQLNLQTILQGRTLIDGRNANVRAGLQDALTGLPAGAGGATIAAGWVNVKPVLQRFATRAEVLFSSGTGTSAAPGALTWEGWVSNNDINEAMNT